MCYLCKKKVGACIQCANRNCFQAFHVTCAREAGLELRMKQGGERGELKAYCDKHSEVSLICKGALQRRNNGVQLLQNFNMPAPASPNVTGSPAAFTSFESRTTKQKRKASLIPGRTLLIKLSTTKSNKSARAYKQSYTAGPPLIPNFIFTKLVDYISRIKMGKKVVFISAVCRYWSLKREARRGAPLLKRLHLEVSSV